MSTFRKLATWEEKTAIKIHREQTKNNKLEWGQKTGRDIIDLVKNAMIAISIEFLILCNVGDFPYVVSELGRKPMSKINW